MAEGEFALVREHLEFGLAKTSSWVGKHDLYAMFVDVAVQTRDIETLQVYAPLAEEKANRYDHHLYQGIVHRAYGVIHSLSGEYSEAKARLNQAMEIFNHLGLRWQLGQTLIELGELERTKNQTAAARDYNMRALEAFEAMHANPSVSRVKRLIEALPQ